MNQNKIITISRQYGSGGRIVGKKLAEALEIPFYDNELITMAAEKTGLSVECFKDAEKTSVGNLFFCLHIVSTIHPKSAGIFGDDIGPDRAKRWQRRAPA